MDASNDWQQAQEWERTWHDNCANSYNEESKQFIYANRMGLDLFKSFDDGGRTIFDFGDKSVIDIGGGAYSLLLKSKADRRTVVDPCNYPSWVLQRYIECGIIFDNEQAEAISGVDKTYDIALIYNCLQHVKNPQRIIDNARAIAKEIRIFEWVDNGISPGHLHDLKADKLDEWLHGVGKVENINQGGCVGKCYYGIFPTGTI